MLLILFFTTTKVVYFNELTSNMFFLFWLFIQHYHNLLKPNGLFMITSQSFPALVFHMGHLRPNKQTPPLISVAMIAKLLYKSLQMAALF